MEGVIGGYTITDSHSENETSKMRNRFNCIPNDVQGCELFVQYMPGLYCGFSWLAFGYRSTLSLWAGLNSNFEALHLNPTSLQQTRQDIQKHGHS